MQIPSNYETTQNLKKCEEKPELAKSLTDIQFHEVTKLIQQKIDSGAHIVAQMIFQKEHEHNYAEQEYAFCGQHRDFLNLLIKIRQPKDQTIAIPEPEEEILCVSDIEKIVLIYELGIIDFIKKKQREHTPRALHQLIYQITEIKTATVKKYIQRIEEHINGIEIETSLVEHFNKAKTMIGKVRETNEILGNKE
jgi:uncharacterized protein (UPF0261 family)